jgi:hypothetical protein
MIKLEEMLGLKPGELAHFNIDIAAISIDRRESSMTKQEALALIDGHKNKLINPVEMLHWTWLRVIINQFTESEWNGALQEAEEVMSR